MKIGICLPYLKAGLRREDYLAWFREIDAGPFDSLCCGERLHGPAHNMGSLLAAAAAVTERVEIVPTLYVLPMHSAVRVAHEIATLQVLSGGRVNRIAVGYGGRERDYQALDVPYVGRYGRMDRQVPRMREVWAQQELVTGAGPIGPVLDHPPAIITGAIGPKSIARGAVWADGLYAWSGNGEAQDYQRAFDVAERAWAEAGREQSPYRMGGFWCSLADDGQARLKDYVYHYMRPESEEFATAIAAQANRATESAILEGIANAAAAGCDEVMLVPATADLAEVQRLSALLSANQCPT